MKPYTLLILLFLFASINCIGQSRSDSGAKHYFPEGVFNKLHSFEGIDTFINNWYSKHLSALEEPILFNEKSDKEIFRFTLLHSFDHPITIRIEKNGENYMLYWKMTSGAGGYSPGTIVLNRQKQISRKKWEEFKRLIEEIDFWRLSTNDPDGIGVDGARWILEGRTTEKYQVADRFSPTPDSKYYQCCYYLIKLSKLTKKIKYLD